MGNEWNDARRLPVTGCVIRCYTGMVVFTRGNLVGNANITGSFQDSAKVVSVFVDADACGNQFS